MALRLASLSAKAGCVDSGNAAFVRCPGRAGILEDPEACVSACRFALPAILTEPLLGAAEVEATCGTGMVTSIGCWSSMRSEGNRRLSSLKGDGREL